MIGPRVSTSESSADTIMRNSELHGVGGGAHHKLISTNEEDAREVATSHS